MTLQNILTVIFALAGLIFMTVSLIGIIRLPDFFTRLHAQGIGDTLGALLLIIAMMTATGLGIMSIKIFLIFVVIALTNPLGTNLMMIAAMNNREYREYKKKNPDGSPKEEGGAAGRQETGRTPEYIADRDK